MIPPAPDAVLDHDRLAEDLGQACADEARRDVGAAAGAEADQELIGRVGQSCARRGSDPRMPIVNDTRNAVIAGTRSKPLMASSPFAIAIMAGLVPAISIRTARSCHIDRDHRDKPGEDDGGLLFYFSSSIGFDSTPTPSMSISQVSPFFIQTGGLRAMPTPDGVPVKMMSPGSSVMPCVT